MTSYTVTGTTTNNSFGGGFFQVQVLDNAAVAGSPAVGSSSTAYNCSVTTTQAGSFVFGVINNDNDDNLFTYEASSSEISHYQSGANDTIMAAFKTTSATGTPGATTVGASTAFSGLYGIAAMEVLASGGSLTVDGSSPVVVDSDSATSFMTASFNPPAGTVLVAMLSVTGNNSASVCAATVSSSPSLTWTEQVKVSVQVGSVNAYVGAWTALVPSGGGTPASPGRQLPSRPYLQVFSAGPSGRGSSY